MNQNPNITNDERLEALLMLAEQQAQQAQQQGDNVNELVATLEQVTAVITRNNIEQKDVTTEQYKQLLLRLENLANKIVTENTLTKTEITNLIANTVNIYFVRNLTTSLSDEVKNNIQNAIGSVVSDLISKAVHTDLTDLKSEIRAIREQLRDTADETRAISKNINDQLREEAEEIVGNGVTQILQGVQRATASYQHTVTNLEKMAVVSQKKTQPIFDGLENVGELLQGRIFLFTGLFCLGAFLLSMLTAFIIYQIVVPTKSELQSRSEYLESTQLTLDYMNKALATKDYEWKDNRLYLGVDRFNCYDRGNASFCPAKSTR